MTEPRLTEVPAPKLAARPTPDGGLVVTPQPEPVRHWVLDDDGHRQPAYALVQDGNGSGPVELWQRVDDGSGVLNAMARAAHLSLRGDPVNLQLPSGRVLARFVGGCREGRTRPLRAPVRSVDE